VASHKDTERLFNEMYPYAYRYARSLIGRDAFFADDLVAEIMLELLVSEFIYTTDPQARALLGMKVRSRWADYLRRSAYRHASSLSLDDLENQLTAPSPERVIEERDQTNRLHEAISKLPPRQQLAINLRYFQSEPVPIEQIAQILDTTPGGVKSSLHKAKASLKC